MEDNGVFYFPQTKRYQVWNLSTLSKEYVQKEHGGVFIEAFDNSYLAQMLASDMNDIAEVMES